MKNIIQIIIIFISCLIFFYPMFISAQEIYIADSTFTEQQPITNNQPIELRDNYSFNVVKVAIRAFVSLILIIILIFLAVYVIKRFYLLKKNNQFFHEAIKVLGTVPLSPKKSIYLVKIMKQILVIGITEENMTLLTEIQDDNLLEKLEKSNPIQNNQFVSFKSHLNKLLKRHGNE